MEIDPKYKSPRKRQKKKIDFARKLLPIFERCRNELGSYAAQNEIAQWMNDHEVPTKDGRRTYQWTSGTVGDYLNFDGLEPTPENVAAPKTKNEGMRVSITRAFQLYDDYMVGKWTEEDRLHAIKRHEEHVRALGIVAESVRRALGKGR